MTDPDSVYIYALITSMGIVAVLAAIRVFVDLRPATKIIVSVLIVFFAFLIGYQILYVLM